jgi:general secretion pathway protein G
MAAMRSGSRLIVLVATLAVVVVAVLYLLRSGYTASAGYAKETALKSNLFLMRDAIDKYASENGKCPDSLKALANDRYLRAVPVDPMTGSASTWQFSQDANRSGCDVKSGSPQQARDGSRYANW